jgi:MerR family redox-sensitive transcriptional activator SoxR
LKSTTIEMEATLTIGEVARRAGLKTSTIRYYEARGVLPTPERRSGQRRYTEQTVERLHVIDVAKRAGFSLDDARVLLATADDGTPASAQIRELAQRKLPEVEALIARAQAMRQWLQTATGCNCRTLDVCALFDDQALIEPHAGDVALSITHVRR